MFISNILVCYNRYQRTCREIPEFHKEVKRSLKYRSELYIFKLHTVGIAEDEQETIDPKTGKVVKTGYPLTARMRRVSRMKLKCAAVPPDIFTPRWVGIQSLALGARTPGPSGESASRDGFPLSGVGCWDQTARVDQTVDSASIGESLLGWLIRR
jgi:hypothetical protein